jgi:hypothetical protein
MTDNEPDTELTPTAQAPEVPEAWSLDDVDRKSGGTDVTPDQPRRHGPIVSLGLVVLVVGVIGCVIVLGAAFFNWRTSKHAEPSHVPSPAPTPTVAALPTTPVAPPPPTTVTVTPTPEPVFSAALDQRLLTTLAAKFYTITDPALVIQHAHRYCVLVQQQGIPADQARQIAAQEALSAHPVGNQVGMESTYPSTGTAWAAVQLDWDMLTTTAMTVYPHCGTGT